MPESSEDILYCRVFVGINADELKQMGIAPPEDICETIAVKFAEIRYIISAGNYSRLKLLDGSEWICNMGVDEAFTLWVEWQKRNPGK